MLQSRKFYYTLFVLGALYTLLVQQFFQNEGRFILQAPSYSSEVPYSFDTDFQELNLHINKETVLHGVWFKHKNPKGLILLFPDSDLDIRELEIDKNHYYNYGFDVLITAYRSTAVNIGKLNHESDLFSDARHWYNFSKSQFTENEIILVGNGFGGSIAAQLSGSRNPKALILENPYFAFGDYQAKSRFWWLPYSYFTSFKLNTWEYVRRTENKIILIQDETKRGQENCLTTYLKQGDKAYWISNTENIPNSFRPENSVLFKEILKPLFPSDKPK